MAIRTTFRMSSSGQEICIIHTLRDAVYSESLRTFLSGVRLSNCTSDHFAVAPHVVFLCRQWKLVVLLGENVFLEIEGTH